MKLTSPLTPPAGRPDVEGIKARAKKATPGEWIAKGMGGDSYVLAPTHKWHRPSLCKRGYPIAIPRPYQEMDGHQTVDFSSAGFAHDDAKFIAHARQDIPTLIAYIKALEAKQEIALHHLQADGALDRRLLCDLLARDPKAPWIARLAALGDGDG